MSRKGVPKQKAGIPLDELLAGEVPSTGPKRSKTAPKKAPGGVPSRNGNYCTLGLNGVVLGAGDGASSVRRHSHGRDRAGVTLEGPKFAAALELLHLQRLVMRGPDGASAV